MEQKHLTCWHNRIALTLILSLLLAGFGLGSQPAAAGPNIWTNVGPTHRLNQYYVNKGADDVAIVGNTWLAALDNNLYRSTDQGGNWQEIYNNDNTGYSSYFVTSLSARGNDVYANFYPPNVTGGPGGHFEGVPELRHSTDGGASWLTATLVTNGRLTRISYGADGQTLYVAAAPDYHFGIPGPFNGYPLEGFFSGGLYKSNDGGQTWMTATVSMAVNNVLIDPADPNHLWAAGMNGLAESHDGGATWTKRVTNPKVGGLIYSDAGNINTLYAYGTGDIVNPSEGHDGFDGYITSGPLYKSSDGGSTWKAISIAGAPANYSVIGDVDSGALAVSGKGHIVVGWQSSDRASSGVAESNDGGITWRTLNGLGLSRATRLLIDDASGQILDLGAGLFSYTTTIAPPDPAFDRVWQREDAPVAAGKASRSWTWGAQPFATMREPMAGLAGGDRLVRYYDKTRMEVNDPSADPNQQWYVTNGRLVVELVSGKLQTGLNQTQSRSAALINVAGDADGENGVPTYASFYELASFDGHPHPSPNRTGQSVSQSLDRGGKVGSSVPASTTVKLAQFDATTQHNIAAPMWDFLNRQGTVLVNGQYVSAPVYADWVYVMGHPITEPYWAKMWVSGTTRWVLVQLFERRTLTYTPSNAPAWQVEMGNVGLHYYLWRYGN